MKSEIIKKYYYRYYDDLVVLYDKVSNIYVLFEDIFAEMFYIIMNESEDDDYVIKKIISNYDVDYDTVYNDFYEFKSKLGELLSKDYVSHQSNPNSDSYEETESYIFDLMSERQIPFTANIEITDNCNLKCSHCYRSQESNNLLTIEKFEEILKELKELGTLHIVFAGSEPLMHPDILKLIDLVSEYGFVLTLQTNATLVNEKVIDKLKKCSVKMVFVSLYSSNKNIHESITRVKGSFEKTLNGIKLLLENNFIVRGSVSIFDKNKNEVFKVNDLCKKLGIQAGYNFKIIPAIDNGKDTISLNCFNEEEMLNYILNPKLKLFENEIKRSYKKIDIVPYRYCDTGFRSITITFDLNIVICNAYRKVCGSLLNSSIKDIWYKSKVLNHWRKEGSLVNNKCKSCKAYQFCEPCPAHQFTKYGNDDKIDEITCSYGKMFWNVCEKAKRLKSY